MAEGLAPVKVGERWGYINRTGKVVIPPRFRLAGPFAEGLAAIEVDGKYGYIDRTRKMVIPPQFMIAEPFSEGLALLASANYKFAFINRGEKIVIPPPSFSTWHMSEGDPWPRFSGGLAPVLIDKKCGFVDRDGKLAIQPQFLGARNFSNGLAPV